MMLAYINFVLSLNRISKFFGLYKINNLSTMESLSDLLSPEQIDFIVTAYGSVESWLEQALLGINIIVEDIFP